MSAIEDKATKAVAFFREFYGADMEAVRAKAITELPAVVWKGRHLRTLRCKDIATCV